MLHKAIAMFWFGMILALFSGLFGIGLIRSYAFRHIPFLHDIYFDIALLILLITGLGLAAIKHFSDQKEIQLLKQDVELASYVEVSTYSPTGNKGGFKIYNMNSAPTPINDWSDQFVVYKDNKAIFECKPGAREACRKVIDKLPNYPFSYLFLAQCLRAENDNSWVDMAKMAKGILEKTTMIHGHNDYHDAALKDVKALLENR